MSEQRLPLIKRLPRDSVRRNTAVMVAGAMVIQVFLVVTGILLARTLGPADRGHLALLILVPAILWQLGTLGMSLAVTYALAREPRWGTAIWARIREAAKPQLAALLVAEGLAVFLLVRHEPSPVQIAGAVTISLIPSLFMLQYALAVLQGRSRFVAFNLVMLTPLAAFTVVLVVLALLGSLTLVSTAIAYCACQALAAIAGWFVSRPELDVAPDENTEAPPTLGWLIRFGLRSLLSSSNAPIEAYRLDQAVVGLFLSAAALGNYVVAASLTNLPRFVALSAGRVIYPRVASERDPEDARRSMWRLVGFGSALVLPIVVILWLLASSLIPLFFGDAFEGAVPITRILLINSALVSTRRLLSDGIAGLGRPGLGSIAEIAAVIGLFPLLAVLVPAMETRGVAWAVTGSSALGLSTLLILLFSRYGDTAKEVDAAEVPREQALVEEA